MNADDLKLEQPLSLADAPDFAEDLSKAARLVETTLRGVGFKRQEIGRAQEVPHQSGSKGGVRLRYQRGPLTATVDIWDHDCQFTPSHRCFAFRTRLDVGEGHEAMPFNRWKAGRPSRQCWRQRTDYFVQDLSHQLELLTPASPEGRLHGVIEEVHAGYGFLRSAAISRLFFHHSALTFSWSILRVGLHVSFVPGENDKGRDEEGRVALAIELAVAPEEIIPARRDQATSRPAPKGVRPVEDPAGADADRRNLGRIVEWKGGYGFMETLVNPRLFIHRTTLTNVTQFGDHLRGRGVRFRLAQDDKGRQSALDGTLLPERTGLQSLFQDELARGAKRHRDSLRFRYAAENSFECTKEKRPTITVAALKDIVENSYLLFVHTRWADLKPMDSGQWFPLAQVMVNTFFLGVAPRVVYLSTERQLYLLDGAQSEPTLTPVNDLELKAQLEIAAPHSDD